mmetsp:Transcript_36903/g.78283  ORF Transcript_36903/g.78283 Transcript_36903/m.78283 type:complete len:129 (+) Transcript_36903:127-513(+)
MEDKKSSQIYIWPHPEMNDFTLVVLSGHQPTIPAGRRGIAVVPALRGGRSLPPKVVGLNWTGLEQSRLTYFVFGMRADILARPCRRKGHRLAMVTQPNQLRTKSSDTAKVSLVLERMLGWEYSQQSIP